MHPWMTEQLNRQHIEDLRSLGRPFGVTFRWRRLRRQGVARLRLAQQPTERPRRAGGLPRGMADLPKSAGRRVCGSRQMRFSTHRLRRAGVLPHRPAGGCLAHRSGPG